MKYLPFLVFWLVWTNAHATSFGLKREAKLAIIDDMLLHQK